MAGDFKILETVKCGKLVAERCEFRGKEYWRLNFEPDKKFGFTLSLSNAQKVAKRVVSIKKFVADYSKDISEESDG